MSLTCDSELTVLLVEQDCDIRALWSDLLTSYGYKVVAAANGTEALACVTAHPPQAVFSSLVFDDIDGFELVCRLRSLPETSNALIVAVTGYSDSGIKERIANSGFDGYFLKPVSIFTMLAMLQSLDPKWVRNAERFVATSTPEILAFKL